MQKKLITLAVASLGVTGVALADSNVTLYGVIDLGYNNYKTSRDIKRSTSAYTDTTNVRLSGETSTTAVSDMVATTKFSGLEDGKLAGARIGVKGSEVLGRGLKAIFGYEFKLSPDVSTSGIEDSRTTYLGLAGRFGAVVAGYLQTAPKAWVDTYNPTTSKSFGGKDAYEAAAALVYSTLRTSSRAENAIGWRSPNWNGFTMKAGYSFKNETEIADSTDTDERKRRSYSLNANYEVGPFGVGLILADLGKSNGDIQENGIRSTGIGAHYDFGVADLSGTYARVKRSVAPEKPGAHWSLGMRVPVGGSGKVYLSYAGSRPGATDATDSDGLEQAVDGTSRFYSLGYTHNMSKRTAFYAGFTGGRSGELVGVSGTNDIVYTEKYTGYNVGLNHKF